LEIEHGAVIKKPGSSLKNKTGSWRTRRPIIIQKKCVKCGICWEVCPDNAINKIKEQFKVDKKYCKGCLICVTECPYNAIRVVDEK
jgi:2-oxoacid:acceptor oxidoreductase delta subunit (pyruvate/2-ketoisovalerate family)